MSSFKVALITGAAAGIGRAMALELANKCTAIAAVDVHADGLRSLAEELAVKKCRCAWRVADVTAAEEMRIKTAELERELGPIDLLIANAGIGSETSALRFDAAVFARIIEVNLIGVANSLAAVLPGMLQRKQGHLVGISSVASFRGLPRMLAYCASKSGVNALMEGVRVEVKNHGIHVTTICPSWIRTAMTAQIDLPMENLLSPDEAARVIVRAIERRLAFYAFPRKMAWRLRFLRWLPLKWQDDIIGKMAGGRK
jgi:3-oxoacyl-[acyl-carrier protein] reductase